MKVKIILPAIVVFFASCRGTLLVDYSIENKLNLPVLVRYMPLNAGALIAHDTVQFELQSRLENMDSADYVLNRPDSFSIDFDEKNVSWLFDSSRIVKYNSALKGISFIKNTDSDFIVVQLAPGSKIHFGRRPYASNFVNNHELIIANIQIELDDTTVIQKEVITYLYSNNFAPQKDYFQNLVFDSTLLEFITRNTEELQQKSDLYLTPSVIELKGLRQQLYFIDSLKTELKVVDDRTASKYIYYSVFKELKLDRIGGINKLTGEYYEIEVE
ncbi:MAG TPA: hypothetical protein DIW47_08570 [Bacteroidetes bacterium]|nr:hypothetical protein [Bacteroidota bacterium]